MPVTVQVLDVNDNPPKINTEDEIIICESTRAGQASPTTAELFLRLTFSLTPFIVSGGPSKEAESSKNAFKMNVAVKTIKLSVVLISLFSN